MPRFDEMELHKPGEAGPAGVESARSAPTHPTAPIWRRAGALLIDLSLFAALAIALSPLLPHRATWAATLERDGLAIAGLVGFLILISYYYFVGAWLIWGKTVGSAILEVRILEEAGTPLHVATASRRWLGTLLSILTAGIGFLLATLPPHRSLADRISGTLPVSSA